VLGCTEDLENRASESGLKVIGVLGPTIVSEEFKVLGGMFPHLSVEVKLENDRSDLRKRH
jgi:hypothetical protein